MVFLVRRGGGGLCCLPLLLAAAAADHPTLPSLPSCAPRASPRSCRPTTAAGPTFSSTCGCWVGAPSPSAASPSVSRLGPPHSLLPCGCRWSRPAPRPTHAPLARSPPPLPTSSLRPLLGNPLPLPPHTGAAFPAFTSSLVAIKSIILFNRSGVKDTEVGRESCGREGLVAAEAGLLLGRRGRGWGGGLAAAASRCLLALHGRTAQWPPSLPPSLPRLQRFNEWIDREAGSNVPQHSLLVYPEGTRSQRHVSLPLKRGMLRYAHSRGLPVQVRPARWWAALGCVACSGPDGGSLWLRRLVAVPRTHPAR